MAGKVDGISSDSPEVVGEDILIMMMRKEKNSFLFHPVPEPW